MTRARKLVEYALAMIGVAVLLALMWAALLSAPLFVFVGRVVHAASGEKSVPSDLMHTCPGNWRCYASLDPTPITIDLRRGLYAPPDALLGDDWIARERNQSLDRHETYDGIEQRFRSGLDGGTSHHFGEFDHDEFKLITCSSGPRHPSWWCDYHFTVEPGLRGTAKFVDFRLHGGRAFANERVGLIRRTVCGFHKGCRDVDGAR